MKHVIRKNNPSKSRLRKRARLQFKQFKNYVTAQLTEMLMTEFKDQPNNEEVAERVKERIVQELSGIFDVQFTNVDLVNRRIDYVIRPVAGMPGLFHGGESDELS